MQARSARQSSRGFGRLLRWMLGAMVALTASPAHPADLVWQYVDDAAYAGRFEDVVDDGEGGVLAFGEASSAVGAMPKGLLARIDRDGKLLWRKTFAPRDTDGGHLNSAIRLPDGDILAVGWTRDPKRKFDRGWVVRVGADGGLRWQRVMSLLGSRLNAVTMLNRPTTAPGSGPDVVAVGTEQNPKSSLSRGILAFVAANDASAPVFQGLDYFPKFSHKTLEALHGYPHESSAETLAILDNGDLLIAGWARGLPGLKKGPWVMLHGADLRPKWTRQLWPWTFPETAPGDATILRLLRTGERTSPLGEHSITAFGDVQLTKRYGLGGLVLDPTDRIQESTASLDARLLVGDGNASLRPLAALGRGKYLAAGVKEDGKLWLSYFQENGFFSYRRVHEEAVVQGEASLSGALAAGLVQEKELIAAGSRLHGATQRGWVARIKPVLSHPWKTAEDLSREAMEQEEFRWERKEENFLHAVEDNMQLGVSSMAHYRNTREVAIEEYARGRTEEANLLLQQMRASDETSQDELSFLMGIADEFSSLGRLQDEAITLRWLLDVHQRLPSSTRKSWAPTAVLAGARLAWLLAGLGKANEAQTYAAEALAAMDKSHKYGMALFYLGRYYRTRGYLNEAENLLRQACLDRLQEVPVDEPDEAQWQDPAYRMIDVPVPELVEMYRQADRLSEARAFLTGLIGQVFERLERDETKRGKRSSILESVAHWLQLQLVDVMQDLGLDDADSELIRLLGNPNRATSWSRLWLKTHRIILLHRKAGLVARAETLQAALVASTSSIAPAMKPYAYLLLGDRVAARDSLESSAARNAIQRLAPGDRTRNSITNQLVTQKVLRNEREGMPPPAERNDVGERTTFGVTDVMAAHTGASAYWAGYAQHDLRNYAEELREAGYLDAAKAFFGQLAEQSSDYQDRLAALSSLTEIALAQKTLDAAVKTSTEGMSLVTNHLAKADAGNSTIKQDMSLARKMAELRVAVLHQAQGAPGAASDLPTKAEAFLAGQVGRTTSAAVALAQMSSRFALGNDELAVAIRERQELARELGNAEKALIKAEAEQRPRWQREIKRLDGKLTTLVEGIRGRFPVYVDWMGTAPVSAAQVQKVLAQDEALVSLLVSDKETYLWAVGKNDVAFVRVPLGRRELDSTVRSLRRALDPSGYADIADLRNFPLAEAHALYARLFGPLEKTFAGIKHLLVVPDGPLQSLPLSVLLMEAPQQSIKEPGEYRGLAWMGKRYALTTLPSVNSLTALRLLPKGVPGSEPFAGFGDPVLQGGGGEARKVTTAALFSRGIVANVDEVRKLAPLPETAGELLSIAGILKADPGHVFLRERATESTVRSLDLSRFQVLSFATHGAMAGEFPGVAEPFLVLTPPTTGSELDDGLLTASEVAKLKLNANWVILSACNTAAADGTPGAEGLSGLASAFLYAGSRSMLVSHWAVASDATAALTTRIVIEAAKNETIGRAEALKQAMLFVMNDAANRHFSHPMFWAPFVVVGEGGAGR